MKRHTSFFRKSTLLTLFTLSMFSIRAFAISSDEAYSQLYSYLDADYDMATVYAYNGYLNLNSETDEDYVFTFRSYTGAIGTYYADKTTGDVYQSWENPITGGNDPLTYYCTLVGSDEGDVGTMDNDTSDDSSDNPAQDSDASSNTNKKTGGHTVAIYPVFTGTYITEFEEEPIGPNASQTAIKYSNGLTGVYSAMDAYTIDQQIGFALRDNLQQRGYDVVLTKNDDYEMVSGMEAAQMADDADADIMISLYYAAAEEKNGAMALVPGTDNQYVGTLSEASSFLGKCIIDAYCETTNLKNNGVETSNDMTAMNWSTMPTMFLKLGGTDSDIDDPYIGYYENWTVMAAGIADGIDAYFANEPDLTNIAAGAGSEGSIVSGTPITPDNPIKAEDKIDMHTDLLIGVFN